MHTCAKGELIWVLLFYLEFVKVKCCRVCGLVKTLPEFSLAYKNKDGRDNTCKLCKCIRSRKHYNLNSDRIKKQQRESYLIHKGIKDLSVRKYQSEYPNKVRAHRAVNDGIRYGKIKPQPCQQCGISQAVAHHDDYLQPLKIRWLCPKHHAEWHRINGKAANGK